MIHPHPLPSEEVKYIHEVLKRPLTLKECDEALEWRRMYGDLQPKLIEGEMKKLSDELENIRGINMQNYRDGIKKIISTNDMILFDEEMKNFRKTGIPRCIKCKKDFIADGESKEKKYVFKPRCECLDKNIRICIL